jgi:RNA polymerase sigma-70 factor, ECF subfamily
VQAQVHSQEQVHEQVGEPRRRPDRAAVADRRLTAAVQAAQEGDESAFRQVFHAVHPRLLGYVRTMVTGPDAEDVTAEAWLHISRDLSRFSGDADRFRGWTHRIARNRALDHLRARGRRPQECGVEDAGLIELPAGVDTAEAAMEAVATSRVFDLVATLPREQAGAVVLRAMLGLDAKRAAVVLGCRPGAVRTATHRGLRRLAQLVAERPEHEPSGVALPASPAVQKARGASSAASGTPAVPAPVTKSERAAQ